MVNPPDVHGRRLAMVAWGEKAEGSEDVVVFAGTARWDGEHVTMVRDPEAASIRLLDEWVDRLQPVPPDLETTLLEAELYFCVTLGPLPADADMSEYLKTGLKWPTDDES